MKFLIFLSCALAFASAGYPYYASPYAHHVPLINEHGVPVETPEVQEAKALHFAAHAAAKHGLYISGSYGDHGSPAVAADGTPIDTPEVQLAKAAHFIAYNQAALRNHYGAHAGVLDGPLDTPEVQEAKAAHFAAHAEAKARAAHHYRKRRGLAYNYQPHPGIGHNGVPLDTPEVEAAKASHFAAHARVSSHNALAPAGASFHYDGSGGYHVPVIGHNGVPVETPEVQAAKASHFAAYSKEGSGGYSAPAYGGHYAAPPAYGNGAPLDTPEVQAAKAAHLAAHQAASGHRYY